MKFLLFAVLLLCSCALILSRSANKDEIDIVVLLKERLSLPKTESNKELLEKLGLSQKSTWEKTKEFLGKSEEQYIVENLKQRMGLPLDDKSNIILKDELLGLPSFQIPQRTWLQRLADIFGLGRKTMKERLYDALGGAAALEMLRRSTSDIAGQATKKVEDTMSGLKEKAYEKIGENVAGTVKEKGHNYKETLTCNTKECEKISEKEPSHGMLWGMLNTVSYFVFGNQTKTKTKQDQCSGDYYSAKECAKEKAKETLESAKDTVVCTAEMAKDKLCDIRDTAMEKGAEALHTAQAATHKVENLYESTKEKVEEVVDRSKEKAKEKLGDVKERAKDTYEDIKEKAKDTYEGAKEKLGDVKEKAKDTYEGAKEKLGDVKEKAKEKLGDVKEKAKDTYKDVKNKGKETLEEAQYRASDMYEGTKEGVHRAYEQAKESASKINEKVGEKYEEAKEKLSETKDQFFGKLDLTRDETGIIEKLRNRIGLSKDMGYADLLEKLGYGKESLPASSRVNLTPEEIRVVEKLNEYHASYRRKPALEQFKENIGYNEEPARRHVHHQHLRDQAGMEGKAFPEDISGFGDVINEQKNLKGRIPV